MDNENHPTACGVHVDVQLSLAYTPSPKLSAYSLGLHRYHCRSSLAYLFTQLSWGAAQLTSHVRASLLGFVASMSSSSSVIIAAELSTAPIRHLFILHPGDPFPEQPLSVGLHG